MNEVFFLPEGKVKTSTPINELSHKRSDQITFKDKLIIKIQ